MSKDEWTYQVMCTKDNCDHASVQSTRFYEVCDWSCPVHGHDHCQGMEWPTWMEDVYEGDDRLGHDCAGE